MVPLGLILGGGEITSYSPFFLSLSLFYTSRAILPNGASSDIVQNYLYNDSNIFV